VLFNSVDFALFLPLVFLVYWFVTSKSLRLQNLFILLASYFFYGCWDYRFLGLILFSTVVDYTIGLKLKESEGTMRRYYLYTSLFVNLGLLGVFKYYNFFIDSFSDAFSIMGYDFNPSRLNIILPVGISFYTFQTLSYTIDVYKRKLEPDTNFISFAAFVSFFPQLVAGPIERASNLLPQFHRERTFDYSNAKDGLRQILWGLFKKVVIADNCAHFVDIIFNNSADQSGSNLVLGAVFFAFQIYGDFSGYSDIAIGTAKLFGFNLMKNFAFPYFSRDIAEFWRRWHISLSTWFRDYLYIPLGGSRKGKWMSIRNVFIIFIVSGFWHGANWTFILWGALNALFILPLLVTNRNRANLEVVAKGKLLPSIRELLHMLLTFGLTVFAWVFFRAESIGHAFSYIDGVFTKSLFSIPALPEMREVATLLILLAFFIIVEWFQREEEFGLATLGASLYRPLRWGMYSGIIFLIGMFMQTEETPFIYFQF